MTEMGGQLMVLAVGPRRYAVSVSEVAEVNAFPELHPIPGAPPLLAGAMNSHGRILPVISLAELWGLASTAAEGKVVVFDDWVAAMAVLVDEVLTIVPAAAVLEEDESQEPGVVRQLMLADGEAGLLSCQGLLEEMERRLRDRRFFGTATDSLAVEA
jgi:chemotaxis signal transduction protein